MSKSRKREEVIVHPSQTAHPWFWWHAGNVCQLLSPDPGDAIIAHISPGKGLVVHQESCPNLRGYNREPDKYQPVQWDMEQLGEQEFRTSIVVEVVNHQGVLAQLANVIAATGANIHSISTEEKRCAGVSGQLADHHQTSCASGEYHAQNSCHAGCVTRQPHHQ